MIHSRKKYALFVALAVIGCGFGGCGDAPRSADHNVPFAPIADGPGPNIVWIILDACRASNLSAYGYGRDTSPNIDALAKRGVLFERAYAQSNFTARSVPSYMSGRYFAVSTLDVRGRLQFIRKRPKEERMLPEILSANGYRTAMFSAHLGFIRGPSPLWNAFDEARYVHKSNPSSVLPSFGDINEEVFQWLDTDFERPFFLYLHTLDTHMPHVLSPPYDRWLDENYSTDHLTGDNLKQVVWRKDGQPYSDADKAHLRALHDGSIAYADAQIGRLLARLEAKGLMENTIIVLGADHGDALGEDGRTIGHLHAGTSDEVLQVPLIMAGPGIPAGLRLSEIVENVDIVPTLIELLKLKTSARPHGVSLVPNMRSTGAPPPHEYAFAWIVGQGVNRAQTQLYDGEPAVMLCNDEYKYEFDPTTGATHMWRMPDSLSNRVDRIAYKKTAAKKMQKIFAEELSGLREAYLNLPVTAVLLESTFIPRISDTPEAFVKSGDFILWETGDGASNTDNKWSYNEGFIWSCGWRENAPAITLRFDIPNGLYHAEVTLFAKADIEGHAASSIRLRLEDETEFRTFSVTESKNDGGEFVNVALGDYEITDGAFDVVFDEGDSEHWTYLSRFRLVVFGEEDTVSHDAESFEERREREEGLEALGYLNESAATTTNPD